MENYINLFENIIEKTNSKADYIDIRSAKGEASSLIMKDGDLKEINTGISMGARIRVLKNGAWGFAYTNDLRKLDEISKTAIKMADKLQGEVKLKENKIIKDNIKTNAKIPLSDITIEEKKEIMKEAEKASNISDEIKSTTISYTDSENTSIFINSEGTQIKQENSNIRLSMNAIASDGEINQIAHNSLGGVKGFELIQNADIEKFAREIAIKAKMLLKAKPAPSGQYDIVTDNILTGVFIHEAVGHAVEGDLILQNDSILKDRLNQKIGSEIVNIYDNPTLKEGFGYYEYDSEGVKTSKTQIIENGKLKNYLTSRESASKLNCKLTGNARSSIADQPIVRMSNTYLEPGNMSFEELIEDIKDGIYLLGSRGGQVDTKRGNFQFNASEGYLIKNGKITTNIRDVSLSGNILETLKNVNGVGKDFKLSVGFCGKGGQIAPVGDGGPHTRILKATVGGSN